MNSKLKEITVAVITIEAMTFFLGIVAVMTWRYGTPEIALALVGVLGTVIAGLMAHWFSRDKGDPPSTN